jgi:UDP-glucose 4-epimerase
MKLVTGATGFLGSALVSAFQARSIQTRCVSRQRHATTEVADADYVALDLRSVEPQNPIFDSVDTIVHLASTTIPSTSMDDMIFDARSNLEMALRLLDAARSRGIKSFIFASSGGTVYGDPVRLPVRESDPTDPRSAYGITKLAVEKYIGLYSRLHGLRGISLRVSNPYGPGQLAGTPIGLIAKLLRDAHAGRPVTIWGDGNIVRDFFHVDDLMRAVLTAVTGDLPGGVYNVGAGYGTSIKEITALVERITGKAVTVEYQPPRNIDVPQIWLDTAKFRAATGWRPETGLEQGIEELWKEALQRH